VPARQRDGGQWGARLLAPAAFLAAATVAVLLIRAGLDSNASEPAATRPAATTWPDRTGTRPATTRARPPAPAPARRTYAIQEGDTLDQVALDHDTTVERLLQLNPRIDPTSLQVGQRIVVPG
jgi:LysM repeat protein